MSLENNSVHASWYFICVYRVHSVIISYITSEEYESSYCPLILLFMYYSEKEILSVFLSLPFAKLKEEVK